MDALATLLDDLAHLPRLDGAACRDMPAVFDATSNRGRNERVRRQALAICNTCPCLRECRDWVASLPPAERPHGVVGGMVIAAGHGGVPRRSPRHDMNQMPVDIVVSGMDTMTAVDDYDIRVEDGRAILTRKRDERPPKAPEVPEPRRTPGAPCVT